MAGPLLATTVLFAADRYNGRKAKYNLAGQPVATSKKCRILLLMSIVFFAICIVLYIYQLSIIDKTYNSTGLTIDRVPQFMVMICLFAILCVAAIIIEIKHLAASKHSPQIMSIAFILMASGIFIMRFGFYMSYTTVGISL
jgi:hypothetical protein